MPVKVTCYEWLEGDGIAISNGTNPVMKSMKTDGNSNKNTGTIFMKFLVLSIKQCIKLIKEYPESL